MRRAEAARALESSLFLPVLLLAVTLLLLTANAAVQNWSDKGVLEQRHAAQEAPLAEAEKVIGQLDAISLATAELAAAGNVNAKRIVDELNKAGISIRRKEPASSE